MKLSDVIDEIVGSANEPISPQQIKETIKSKYPQFFGTERAQENVARGNYSNLDHALLAPIYNYVKKNSAFVIDNSVKPYLVSLVEKSDSTDSDLDEGFPDDLLQDEGLVYFLSTGLYSESGQRIVKIGFTTQDIQTRINQLFTTGTPFRFNEIKSHRVKNYVELEQALHKLLSPFRLSTSREFFLDSALPFADSIVEIHKNIMNRESR